MDRLQGWIHNLLAESRQMSGTPTLTAIGGLTVAADTPDLNALFQSVAATVNALPASDKFIYNGNTIPTASADGNSTLLIPASISATISVPAGYKYVVVEQGSHASLVSDHPNDPSQAVVVGDGFNFQGSASVVASGDGVSNISERFDSGSGVIRAAGTATLDSRIGYGGGGIIAEPGSNATITAFGSGIHGGSAVTVESGAVASIDIDSGSLLIQDGAITNVTIKNNTFVQIGSVLGSSPPLPPPPPTTPSHEALRVAEHASPAQPAFTNQINASSSTEPSAYGRTEFDITDATSRNLIALGTSNLVNAAAGASTVFGLSDDTVNVGNGASLFFVGGAGVSSVHGDSTRNDAGTGNVTLFATSAQEFDVGAAQANIFVGGSAASTVNANAGGGAFFGGTHGDLYNSGSSQSQTFVGLGGADTINSAAGSVAPVIYAENAEHMTVAGAAPATVVAFASGGSVDLSGTSGSNVVFAGYAASGNQTLVGSTSSFDAGGNATHDTFVFGFGYSPSGNGATTTITNWHGGDVMYLSGFPQFDNADMASAISNSLANGSAGDLSIHLSDNSTIQFVGSHPTNFSGNAAF